MQDTLGITPSPQFPGTRFDEINKRVAKASAETKKDQWHGFAAAWNAVAYRTVAAEAYSGEFTASLQAKARYLQDHAIFGFAFTSASAVECFYYAANSVGHLVNPTHFPMANAKDLKFYPRTVVDRFSAAFAGDVMTTTMDSVLKAAQFITLSDLRIVLFHRGTPPRTMYASVGGTEPDRPDTIPGNLKDLPSQWTYTEDVTASMITDLNDWRRKALGDLIGAMDTFTATRLP